MSARKLLRVSLDDAQAYPVIELVAHKKYVAAVQGAEDALEWYDALRPETLRAAAAVRRVAAEATLLADRLERVAPLLPNYWPEEDD